MTNMSIHKQEGAKLIMWDECFSHFITKMKFSFLMFKILHPMSSYLAQKMCLCVWVRVHVSHRKTTALLNKFSVMFSAAAAPSGFA